MIDAQALVLLPGASLIIPEGVLTRRIGDRAQRVRQAKPEQGLTIRQPREENSGRLQIQIDPDRHVIRRFFPSSHIIVDTGID